ncbi:MAG: aldehyde dehydrogenase family protein [Gemmatimonadales bacterium]
MGRRLTQGALARGHYVAPTVVRLSLDSTLFQHELFVPLLAIGEIASFDAAIAEANRVEYGLTAGIFTGRQGMREQSRTVTAT